MPKKDVTKHSSSPNPANDTVKRSFLQQAHLIWLFLVWPLVKKAMEIAFLGLAAMLAVYLEKAVARLFLVPFFKVPATTGILWTMGSVAGLFAFTTLVRSTLDFYKDFRPTWKELAWVSNGIGFFTVLNLLHFGLQEAGYSYSVAMNSVFVLTTGWALLYENFDWMVSSAKRLIKKPQGPESSSSPPNRPTSNPPNPEHNEALSTSQSEEPDLESDEDEERRVVAEEARARPSPSPSPMLMSDRGNSGSRESQSNSIQESSDEPPRRRSPRLNK